MTRVLLDANVLFSASDAGSVMGRLIEQALLRVDLVTNLFVETEARQNLALKRPQWLPMFERIISRTEQAPMALFELPVKLDPKDQPVLCSAIRSRCQYLVTGDRRDFGHLYDQTLEGVTVVSTGRFAQHLKNTRRSQG